MQSLSAQKNEKVFGGVFLPPCNKSRVDIAYIIFGRKRKDVGAMNITDAAFLSEMQKKFEAKVRENEVAVLEYWKERLDRLIGMKPDGIASLQLEMRKLSDMMGTRVKTLKRQKE